MTPTLDQLATLAAVVDHGTFEAAARHLHVTTSAVSQRIRALETSAGRVVVRRGTPCAPTDAGAVLLRLAREVALLQDEARAELDALAGDGSRPISLPLAVNADSLATWFRPVLAGLAGRDVEVRLHVEDQAHSADLLRRGEVLAAVTSEPAPVQGCAVERLGVLRYRPAAAPVVAERWRRGRGPDWAAMPVVVFNEKDALQDRFLATRGAVSPRVRHRVPTSDDFREALLLGLGWGLLPEPQLTPELDAGRLVLLHARDHLDVALHWQRWRLRSPVLDDLGDAVRSAAAAVLRRG